MKYKNEKFSSEELQALNQESIMTQQIFDPILDKYMEMDVDELFNQLLNKYSQFLSKYVESIL